MTWNEFWSWKKLKNREKQISLAREREDFITIQNRRIVTTTVTQTCLADYKTFHHVYGTWDGGDFLCNQCNITGERYTMYQDREYIEQFNTRVLSIYRTWCHSKNRTCLWVMEEKRKVNHAWFSVSLVFCFSWKLFIVYPRSRRVSG